MKHQSNRSIQVPKAHEFKSDSGDSPTERTVV